MSKQFNVKDYPKSIRQLNAFIQLTYPQAEFVQGRGYVYFSAVDMDSDFALDVAGLYTSSVPVCKATHCSFEFWMNQAIEFMKEIKTNKNN